MTRQTATLNRSLTPTTSPLSSGLLQRKCACGQHTVAGEMCEECQKEPLKLQRRAMSQTEPAEVPPIVHEVLNSPGQPLEPATRTFMESRFGADFSSVRVHTDSHAAKSAQAVNALAYTVRRDVVFGADQFIPGTIKGRWLLAHELAHVVQQSAGDTPLQASGGEGGVLEKQADDSANSIVQGRRASTLNKGGTKLQRYDLCRDLADPKISPQKSVLEGDVRDELIRQRQAFGPIEREFPMPGGSASTYRDVGKDDTVIPPEIIGPDPGRADIAQLKGTTLELIEVKFADWGKLLFAETQLLRYVNQANRNMSEVNRYWQQRKHTEILTSVRAMQPISNFPTSPLRIGGTPVSVSWCRAGVIGFKAMGDRDPEVFLCGVTDRGRIDAFLDRVTIPAQEKLDEFIRNDVEQLIKSKAAERSLREAARYILTLPEVRRYVPQGMSDNRIIEMIVSELQSSIQMYINLLSRNMVDKLRQMLQAATRDLLQVSFNALCAKATDMTAKELLDEFNRQMRQRALQLIPDALVLVAQAMIVAMLDAFAKALGAIAKAIDAAVKAIAYLIAVVVIAFVAIVAWEALLALSAGLAIKGAFVSVLAFLAFVLSRVFPSQTGSKNET